MATISARSVTLGDGRMLEVRTSEPDDAAMTLRFRHEVLAQSPYVLTTPSDVRDTEAQQRVWLDRMNASETSVQLLGIVEGALIAMAGLHGSGREKLRHSVDLGMVVRPDFHGIGIGRVLLEMLLAWGRSNPAIERITLDVMHVNTRAIRMYEAAGFVREGLMPRAFRQVDGTYADRIAMGLWVGPDVD